MSFNTLEWVGFFVFAVFSFADFFGERIAHTFGRHRKWYRDSFGKKWWLRLWPGIVMKIIYWIALVFEFVAIFLYWKNASSSSDDYTATLALFFSSSISRRFWILLLFGWGYAWAGLLFVLGSVTTAFVAFGLAISDNEGVSAGLYFVYIFWLICGTILNIVVLATDSRYRHWRLSNKDRKLLLPMNEDPQSDLAREYYNSPQGPGGKKKQALARRRDAESKRGRSVEDIIEEPESFSADAMHYERIQVVTDGNQGTSSTTSQMGALTTTALHYG